MVGVLSFEVVTISVLIYSGGIGRREGNSGVDYIDVQVSRRNGGDTIME